jgi:hypothetical protein
VGSIFRPENKSEGQSVIWISCVGFCTAKQETMLVAKSGMRGGFATAFLLLDQVGLGIAHGTKYLSQDAMQAAMQKPLVRLPADNECMMKTYQNHTRITHPRRQAPVSVRATFRCPICKQPKPSTVISTHVRYLTLTDTQTGQNPEVPSHFAHVSAFNHTYMHICREVGLPSPHLT